MLQKAGGAFTLTGDANFGSNFGLIVKYLKSVSSNPASTGVVRLANTDGIAFRNSGNTADITLTPHADGILQYNSIDLVNLSAAQSLSNKTLTSPTLSGTVAGSVTFSGALTLSSAGTALTVNNNVLISGNLTVVGTINVGGGIADTAFTFSNNQGSAASVTGLVFSSSSVKSAHCWISVRRVTSTTDIRSEVELWLAYDTTDSAWYIYDQEEHGNTSGITWSVTSVGQVQYTSTNVGGTSYSGASRFQAQVSGL